MSSENPSAADLLAHLTALEIEVYSVVCTHYASRLETLLHDDFREYTPSGAEFRKKGILALPLAEGPAPAIVSQGFEVSEINPSTALLTYRCAYRQPNRTLERFSLRVSLWVRGENGWQLWFHAGTPTAPFEIEGVS